MASRQVMRSVSADFCASAGAAIASVMQAVRSAPRRQLSDRIYLVLFNFDTLDDIGNIPRRKHDTRNLSNPHAIALAAGRCGAHLSVIDGREQPFQETVD